MSETENLDWEDFEENEEITEDDQKQSNDLSRRLLIGKFVVTVESAFLKEGVSFDGLQVDLKFRIDNVIEFNQPVMDADGKPVLVKNSDGVLVPLEKKLLISPERQTEFDAMLSGQYIFDQIKYYTNPEDKGAAVTKRRRLFVAKRLGLIDENATTMRRSIWKDAVGRQVVLETEINRYTIQKGARAGQEIVNAQVCFSGYTSLTDAGISEKSLSSDDSFDDI